MGVIRHGDRYITMPDFLFPNQKREPTRTDRFPAGSLMKTRKHIMMQRRIPARNDRSDRRGENLPLSSVAVLFADQLKVYALCQFLHLRHIVMNL